MPAKRFARAAPVVVVLLGCAVSGRQEFAPLFNGRDLSGWKVPQGDNGHWKVVDGVIDYDAESEAPGDKVLWSERSFGDFVLTSRLANQEHPVRQSGGPHHPVRRHAQEGRRR